MAPAEFHTYRSHSKLRLKYQYIIPRDDDNVSDLSLNYVQKATPARA